MTSSRTRLDLLLERLAPGEVREARAVLAREGVPGLIDTARNRVEETIAMRTRFDALARAVEASPATRRSRIEEYLRATASDPKELRGDLRALHRGSLHRVDVPALAERLERAATRNETLAEACLALARASPSDASRRAIDAHMVVELAKAQGRWSRRVEALRLVRDLARTDLSPRTRAEAVDACAALAQSHEHRWVQPAALAALALLDTERACAIALERIRVPAPGGDLLVRERIVDLAGRQRRGPWHEVIALGAADPSDHVRLAAARGERDPTRLETLAFRDESAKVRAAALITLSRRGGTRASAVLTRAVVQDESGIVARTCAEQLAFLARRGRLAGRTAAMGALRSACVRSDLTPEIRASIAEELAEIDLLADREGAQVLSILKNLVPKIPHGGGMRLDGPGVSSITDDRLGRALAVLSRSDFALSAERRGSAILLYRGEARELALWRILFELVHPLPSKRQGYIHTWGRRLRGSLRAPPGGLAEITATRVPGERVLAPRAGGWGRELPLIDDLLSSNILRAAPTAIVGPAGTTLVTPPSSLAERVLAWMRLTLGYAGWAERRRRSLESEEPAVQRAFVDDLARSTHFRIEFVPRILGRSGVTLPTPPTLARHSSPRPPLDIAGAAALLPAASTAADHGPPALDALVRDFAEYAFSAEGNRLPHVAAYASFILLGMLVRGAAIRRSIDHDRKAIPLVMGGWGTRGKSGTERLKAGLLQGIGYECLVKTTGCEAMFIHAIPGIAAREVFIYRPYDKATVWEQRALLRLARRLGVRAFLWECMALQPDLVDLLQAQWMRDDYSTLTNAYPDHEDVQGPAGYDVAQVISEFVPTRGRLFTAEDQMLPILRERAKERHTTIHVVRPRDADLIADDLLARFPYHEHPRNIALVASLAQALGIPASIAVAEMADHVVPDLGVLKVYPRIAHEGRTLDFTNGMSANERTGALSNWHRMAFDKHDPDADPSRWIVTVVNNRADRVARSEVFARFIVEDISAHRHVLIGTNVSGLAGFIREALARHVARIGPTQNLVGTPADRLRIARARVDRAFSFLKIGSTTSDAVLAEIDALQAKPLDLDANELLTPAAPNETHAAAKAAVARAIPEAWEPNVRPFVVVQIARRRTARAILAMLETELTRAPELVERAFADAYTAMFEEQLVPLHDSSLTGDQVIDAIAKSVPPGAHASVMGIQNIKGTGLDFVYRWVSWGMVERALANLASTAKDDRDAALRELLLHDDYGLLDARAAHARVTELRASATDPPPSAYDPVIARLAEIVTARSARLHAKRTETFEDKLRRFVGKTFDYLDSIRRQRLARRVLEDLIAGRVSHSAAAIEMRDVVARAKGAWMRKKT